MGLGTAIPYANNTVTTAIGCLPVSPGCAHCFAEKLVGERLSRNPNLPRYHGVTEWDGKRSRWNGRVNLAPELLAKMVRRTTREVWFIGDLSDLFFEEVPIGHVAEVMAYILVSSQQVAITTTKRSARMREVLGGMDLDLVARFAGTIASGVMPGRLRRDGWQVRYVPGLEYQEIDRSGKIDNRPLPWPLPNYWPGVSVEDQKRADERIPDLIATPAALRWVSFEPLIGPVGLRLEWLAPFKDVDPALRPTPRLGWAVVGGESGDGARPYDLAWPRRIMDQCRSAGVPFFHKQAGAWPRADDRPLGLVHAKGGNPREWPVDLQVREFPEALPSHMHPTRELP